jgi:methionyl-tRNA formyltransferase
VTIQLNPQDRVVAIGSNPALIVFVLALLDAGIVPARIWVIGDRDRIAPADQVALVARQIRLEVVAENDFQKIATLICEAGLAIGCVFGWHRIFSRATIALFEGRLFNLHAGDLPRYRGAGGGSWQVMNGAEHTAAHIHLMQSTVDKGAIYFSHQERLPGSNPTPIDFKNASLVAAKQVITQFVDAINANACLTGIVQNELNAVYFPRLSTIENAVIDFDWPALEIERFIRAFGTPYQGAEFHYAEQAYRVLAARVVDVGIDFHPFCHGLIVNTSQYGVHVACRGGVVIFNDILQAGASVKARHFKVGARLWNSPDRLLASRKFRPSAVK